MHDGQSSMEPLGISLEEWPYPVQYFDTDKDVLGARARMGYVDVPGVNRDAPVALLLHGKNFDSSYWKGTIVFLHNHGYRVVVPDQVGFNKSAKPDVEYSFTGLARNTIDLLAFLGIGRVQLVLGHSTDGALAITLVAHYPGVTTYLLLEDPIGIVSYRDWLPEPTIQDLIAMEAGYTTASYRRFIAHFFANYPASAYEQFVTWRMRVAQSGDYDRFLVAAARTYQMIYRQPQQELLREISTPVLIVASTSRAAQNPALAEGTLQSPCTSEE